MSLKELETAMKKQPKFIRTVRHNKHPVIMNPSYGDKFDEYKIIGSTKLKERAETVRKNKDFAEKIQSIKRSEVEEKEQSKSQEDLYNEESIYAKFTTAEDNKIMPEFHSAEWGSFILESVFIIDLASLPKPSVAVIACSSFFLKSFIPSKCLSNLELIFLKSL